MRLKDIDNPWLVVRLPLILGTFGAVVGTALAPMFVQIFNPSVGNNPDGGPTLDAYSQHHPDWYWSGGAAGLAIGLILAYWTLFVLKRHEEEEAAAPEAHSGARGSLAL